MSSIKTAFTDKSECVEFCKEMCQKAIEHPLVFCRFTGNNNFCFTLVCQDCKSLAVSAKKSRGVEVEDTFEVTFHDLTALHPKPNGGTCFPTLIGGKKKKTIVELSRSMVFAVAENDRSAMIGKNKFGMTLKSKRAFLAQEGEGDQSDSAIKAADAMNRITSKDHVEVGYGKLIPYFVQWKSQNPKLAYDIEPKAGGVFRRLAVVLPHTQDFLPNMLNVFGIDGGFTPDVAVKGLSREELQGLMGDEALHPILADRQYVLSNLTLTVVTGLTLNHSRVLLSYMLSYGENVEDTRYLLHFLLTNGGAALNNKKNIIMSDRGACAGPVDEVLPLAIHHYCPKHLERNLSSFKYEKAIIGLFWEARGAKNEIAYKAAMNKMEKISEKGLEAATYLRAIPHWQLYVIVTNAAVLHEIRSDNLVEGMFATLKEARCQASPIYACSDIADRALAAIHSAEESLPKTGVLIPRANHITLELCELSRQYKAEAFN